MKNPNPPDQTGELNKEFILAPKEFLYLILQSLCYSFKNSKEIIKYIVENTAMRVFKIPLMGMKGMTRCAELVAMRWESVVEKTLGL